MQRSPNIQHRAIHLFTRLDGVVKSKQSNRKIIFLRDTEKPIRKDVQIRVRKIQESLSSLFGLFFLNSTHGLTLPMVFLGFFL